PVPMTGRLRRLLRTRHLVVFGAVAVTLGFMASSVFSVIYPALHTRAVKRQLTAEAVAALPPGAVVEDSGVTGRGSLDGYAVGRLELVPAKVMTLSFVPGGSLGWVTVIPNCGNLERCWLSRGKDHILTMTVAPCQRVDCPTGSSLVTMDVARGGPKS
ncbi:MAG: hypothetical protein M3O32_00720, partial [Actinomycetota bacterium]|nr:hypothetical protein [Actinomycetota bacterium]